MGTSVSQGSPRNPNWQRVMTCYKNRNIPEDRVVSEVWRASENQETPLSEELKSDVVFDCYRAVQSSENFVQALEKINSSFLEKSNNSISAEFAKRVVPIAFSQKHPAVAWKSLFISEITKYVISRDASGFVGEKYRNKTVNDLVNFKNRLAEKARVVAANVQVEVKSIKDWRRFVDSTVANLKNEG